MTKAKYVLRYEYEDSIVTSEFNGHLSLMELQEELRTFLHAVSWHPDTIKELFGEEQEEENGVL